MILLEKINKKYDGNKILNNLTLELTEGGIYGIVGKTGVGKTTLLRLLVGMVNKDSGKVSIFNKEVTSDNYHYLSKIGFFIGNEFYDWLTVEENLKIHCEYYGFYNFEEIDKYLELFNLKRYKNKKIKSLSMGIIQKVAIIRALVTKPKLIILDEPFNFLDYETIIILRDLLKELKENFGVTIILTSHIIKELEEIIDEVIFMKDGAIDERISMKFIKDKINNRISIKTMEPSKVVKLLESELGIKKIIVKEDGEIIIKEYCQLEKVIELMNLNSIKLLGFYKFQLSLEEYMIERN